MPICSPPGRYCSGRRSHGHQLLQGRIPPGEPPEFWTVDRPQEVVSLHQRFVDAGADIILTNTFGCNPHRLKLHAAQDRAYELARRAAELRAAWRTGHRAGGGAGCVGPTGELFEPMGMLTKQAAVTSFSAQLQGLRDGGADIAWIETMSAAEEADAVRGGYRRGFAVRSHVFIRYRGPHDDGLMPRTAAATVAAHVVAPLAIGANCGVGAPDILVSLLDMQDAPFPLVTKGNCGVPHFEGTEEILAPLLGTPELMANYARLAIDAGARIWSVAAGHYARTSRGDACCYR